MSDWSSRYRVQVSFENLDTGEWMEWDYPNVREVHEEVSHQYAESRHPYRIPAVIGLDARFSIHAEHGEDGNFSYIRAGTGGRGAAPAARTSSGPTASASDESAPGALRWE